MYTAFFGIVFWRPCQVLAHRLGLIPIRVDPDKCKWPDDAETETPLKFKLHVRCTNGDPQKSAPLPRTSSCTLDLQWTRLVSLPNGALHTGFPAFKGIVFQRLQCSSQFIRLRP